MTHDDEQELLRLTSILERLHDQLEPNSEFSEPLKKAAVALSVAWMNGLRSQVEHLSSDKELTEEERAHLRSLGIDPDA